MLPLRNEATSKNNDHIAGANILISAAESFARLDRPSVEEIAKFKELFYAFSLKSSSSERGEIANTLARGTYTPRSVALFYAMDDVTIASSTLLFSPVLNDQDLIGIIKRCGFAHAEFIACRNNIGPAVIREILSIDDENRTLFAILKENLSLSTKTVREISDSHEADKTSNMIDENPVAFAGEIIGDPLKSENANKNLMELAGTGGRLGQKTKQGKLQEARRLERAGLGKILLTHARNKNLDAFAFEIKKVTGLPIETTRTILEQRDTGKTATILRALEVRQLQCMKILLLLNPLLGEDIVRFREVTRHFEMLEPQKCNDYLKTIGANRDLPEAAQPSEPSQRRRVAIRANGNTAAKEPIRQAPAAQSREPIDSDVLLKIAG